MRHTASSALVNVVDGAELCLVRLLAESAAPGSIGSSFFSDCEACIAQSDASQLLKRIIGEQAAVAALLSLDEEAVSAISLLAACLDRVKDGSSSEKMLNDLADSIILISTSITSNNARAKSISLLATLYNMRSDPTEKVALLVKMIRLAASDTAENSVLEKWNNPFELVSMLDEWKVKPAGRRELYRAAAEGTEKSIIRQQFTLLGIETYSKSDIDVSGLEAARQAAIGAIRDPVSLFVQQRKILSLPAIQALQENDASLLDLLKVFQEGKLEDYHSFIESKGGDTILSQWELKPEDCSKHMRILSLCSLATEHEEIPYGVVADTLHTTPGDVEKWVIAAVSSGLLSAKMDQLQQKVMVERSVVRKFDFDQWKELQSRLHLWKKNVGGILEAYKQSLSQQQVQ